MGRRRLACLVLACGCSSSPATMTQGPDAATAPPRDAAQGAAADLATGAGADLAAPPAAADLATVAPAADLAPACAAPRADCDHDPSNGCEADTSSDTAHCGACGAACVIANGMAKCDAGKCVVGGCLAGFADCDSDPRDGCEVDTRSNAMNCGKCGQACPMRANAAPTCAMSACGIACAGQFRDCNQMADDGCESDTSGDAKNCGGCGQACAPANAAGNCVRGVCAVGMCNAGFADCNGDPRDGCEIDTRSDLKNCGKCALVCQAQGAPPKCAMGVCGIDSCNIGYADCNNDPKDGCEVDTQASLANCGGCGKKCAPANGVGTCSKGVCGLASCTIGWADCNNDAKDGCEIDAYNDPANCSGCGKACMIPNAKASCSLGNCKFASCNLGWADSNNNPADGCEDDRTAPPPVGNKFAPAGGDPDKVPSEDISLAVGPKGNVYVLSYNDKVIVFDRDGQYLTNYPKSGWTTAWAMTVDPGSGEMWIADTDANRVVHLDANGVMQHTWGGMSGPRGIDFFNNEVYVADYGGNRVLVFTPTGAMQRTMANGKVSQPRGLELDKAGNLWIASAANSMIVEVSPQDQVLQSWATCTTPCDVAYDGTIPRVYVLCEAGDQWEARRPDGTRLFGASTQGSTSHSGIDTSPDGKSLYVAFTHGGSRGVQIYRYP